MTTRTPVDRAALTDALTAASAGPNPPPIDRLLAAAEYVIDRAEPDQVILFGSASRGQFHRNSDFDFLALQPRDDPGFGWTRWTHPETGDEMDVLFDDPERAPERRWLAGTVHAAIFAAGATVFAARGRETVPTLRDQGIDIEVVMKEGRYDLNKALDMARRTRTRLSNADDSIRVAGDEDWHTGCQNIQECFEKGLKALLIAHDRPFDCTHDIRALRKAADADEIGEKPPRLNELTDEDLHVLSNYGKGGGYDAAQGAANPEALFKKCRPAAGALVEYITARVPALLEHDRKRREAQKQEID